MIRKTFGVLSIILILAAFLGLVAVVMMSFAQNNPTASYTLTNYCAQLMYAISQMCK